MCLAVLWGRCLLRLSCCHGLANATDWSYLVCPSLDFISSPRDRCLLGTARLAAQRPALYWPGPCSVRWILEVGFRDVAPRKSAATTPPRLFPPVRISISIFS